MAAKKRRRRAKKTRKTAKKRSHKSGGKMPLKVAEHLAASAVAYVHKRGGKVQRHTKAELKAARKRK